MSSIVSKTEHSNPLSTTIYPWDCLQAELVLIRDCATRPESRPGGRGYVLRHRGDARTEVTQSVSVDSLLETTSAGPKLPNG